MMVTQAAARLIPKWMIDRLHCPICGEREALHVSAFGDGKFLGAMIGGSIPDVRCNACNVRFQIRNPRSIYVEETK